MARILGSPKTGGRPKGTPNRDKGEIVKRLQKIIRDYDALEEILRISMETDTTKDQRLKCHTVIAEYTHAKRKAVEVSGGLELSHEDWLKKLPPL